MFTDVNMVATNVVKVSLVDQVVVEDSYYDPSNYSLTTSTGDGPAVVGVIQMNKSATNDVYLVTNTLEVGIQYTVNVSGLLKRDGDSYSGSGDFITRKTKLDSILRSIPNHYDTRTDSNLFAFLSAVGASDDLIGGSRSDSITFS